MKWWLSIAILFFLSQSFGQAKEIDSLYNILPSLHDTGRVDDLNDLSYHYYMLGKRDSADHYQRMADVEARHLAYAHGIAIALENKSCIALFLDNNFGESESLSREAIRWLGKTANRTELCYGGARFNLLNAQFWESKFDDQLLSIDSLYTLSQRTGSVLQHQGAMEAKTDIFSAKGNFDSAFYYLLELTRLTKKDDSIYTFSVLELRMARLYRGIGDYTTALSDYRQVFLRDDESAFEDRYILINETTAKMEFPELFALTGQFDSAWYYYNRFDTARALEKDLRIYLVSTGETYLLQKQYQKALANLIRSLAINTRLNDQNNMKRAILAIANTYLALGDNKTAIAYARTGLALAINCKSRQFARDAYQVFYSAFEKLKMTDSAFFYYKKYMDTKSLVVSDQTKGRYVAYTYDQKYKLLDTEKLLAEQQLKQASQQRLFLIIGIAVIALCGAIVVWNYALKRKNERQLRAIAESELETQKVERQASEAAFQHQKNELEMMVLRAQMNPHFLFNSLNSINRFILQNNRHQASEYLTKFSRLVRMILQNSQSHLITLEQELDALQLYLEMEALRFNFHFTYAIVYAPSLDRSMLKVPPLLLQPFVENAIWHGLMHKEEPGHLRIAAEECGDQLVFRIRDDGIGRKQSAHLSSKSATKHKSMGLKITSERIAMMQKGKQNSAAVVIDDLVHDDGSAAGTEVIIKIPIVYESDLN